MLKIGIIDADLIDGGTNFPNLASMKISGYHKSLGHEVELLLNYDNLNLYDKVYISKVFTKTFVDESILNLPNVEYGGTGFFYDKAEQLPYHIEHSMPDYSLYRPYVDSEIAKGRSRKQLEYYTEYSIGFTTRGCIRGCEFCVNRNSRAVNRHSNLEEFINPSSKYITLLDDNILACKDWKVILEELQKTGKKFKFQQGLDFRLLNREKMEILKELNYRGDFLFAFDNIKDKHIIEKNLKLWNEIVGKQSRFYVFCGMNIDDAEKDISDMFERISILMKYKHIPYIMRHENYKKSKYEKVYTNVACWCNQPNFFKTLSFREFTDVCQKRVKTEGRIGSCMKSLKMIEEDFPEIADKYLDIKFEK